MPGFSTQVPHGLTRHEAALKLKTFIENVRRDHGHKVRDLRGQWRETTLEFAFTAYGMAIEGTMVVEEAEVRVAGTLPLAAALFRGQIEQTIRGELVRILGSPS
ncbi:MAG TPA: polyhydroxyalkanoic acid system family protein [Pirellulaceae bacterium]|nr:polyhydroxyalkanoic acid system family protein [Pirellulaceae bacterium]